MDNRRQSYIAPKTSHQSRQTGLNLNQNNQRGSSPFGNLPQSRGSVEVIQRPSTMAGFTHGGKTRQSGGNHNHLHGQSHPDSFMDNQPYHDMSPEQRRARTRNAKLRSNIFGQNSQTIGHILSESQQQLRYQYKNPQSVSNGFGMHAIASRSHSHLGSEKDRMGTAMSTTDAGGKSWLWKYTKIGGGAKSITSSIKGEEFVSKLPQKKVMNQNSQPQIEKLPMKTCIEVTRMDSPSNCSSQHTDANRVGAVSFLNKKENQGQDIANQTQGFQKFNGTTTSNRDLIKKNSLMNQIANQKQIRLEKNVMIQNNQSLIKQIADSKRAESFQIAKSRYESMQNPQKKVTEVTNDQDINQYPHETTVGRIRFINGKKLPLEKSQQKPLLNDDWTNTDSIKQKREKVADQHSRLKFMMAANPVVLVPEATPYLQPAVDFYTEELNPIRRNQGKKMKIQQPKVPVANPIDHNLKFMNDLNAYAQHSTNLRNKKRENYVSDYPPRQKVDGSRSLTITKHSKTNLTVVTEEFLKEQVANLPLRRTNIQRSRERQMRGHDFYIEQEPTTPELSYRSNIAKKGLLYEEKEYNWQVQADSPFKPREKKKKWKPDSESESSQSSLPSEYRSQQSFDSKDSEERKQKKKKPWLANVTKDEIVQAKMKQNQDIAQYNQEKAKKILKMIDQAQRIGNVEEQVREESGSLPINGKPAMTLAAKKICSKYSGSIKNSFMSSRIGKMTPKSKAKAKKQAQAKEELNKFSQKNKNADDLHKIHEELQSSMRYGKIAAIDSVAPKEHESSNYSYFYELSSKKSIKELRMEIAKLSFEDNQRIERGIAHVGGKDELLSGIGKDMIRQISLADQQDQRNAKLKY